VSSVGDGGHEAFTAQPDSRNKKCGGSIIDGEQRHAMAAVVGCSIGHPAACLDRFSAFASVPRLLRQQEVKTQMHTDKKG
jgi:hypothetical protein